MKKLICISMVCIMIGAMICLSVSAAGVTIPYDKLTALYNMAGSLKDSVSGKSGTLVNGASIVSDPMRGNVLYLDNEKIVAPGVAGYEKGEGQHAVLAEGNVPDSDQMSISMWYKNKDYRGNARIIDMGDNMAQSGGSTSNRNYNIIPVNNATARLTISYATVRDWADLGYPGPQYERIFSFGQEAPLDEWVHVCLVVDAKSGKPNTLYINGKPFTAINGTTEGSPETPSYLSPKDILSSPFGVGNTYIGRARYNGNDPIYYGYVSDIAIFSVALTEEQVKELAKADFTNGVPTDKPADTSPVTTAAGAVTTAAPVTTAKPVTTGTNPPTSDSAAVYIAIVAALSVISAVLMTVKSRRRTSRGKAR